KRVGASDGESATPDVKRENGSSAGAAAEGDECLYGMDFGSPVSGIACARGSGGGLPSPGDGAGGVRGGGEQGIYVGTPPAADPGRFDKNFANEPKSDEKATCSQVLARIEVSANPVLGEQAKFVKSEACFVKSEMGERGWENGELKWD